MRANCEATINILYLLFAMLNRRDHEYTDRMISISDYSILIYFILWKSHIVVIHLFVTVPL